MGITPGPKSQPRDKENVPAYDVKLERVLGLTVSTNSGLDCDPNSETIAYPAGCTVVLFNPVKSRQHHLLNTSRKTVTCVSFSPDGRYLATGECGHIPNVRVWDLSDNSQASEFPGHKYGINCVAFSPSQKYVVSVGSQHDMIVNVWDWKSGVKVASNKVSTKVKAVSFSENGNYFVTVGNRHVKFWYLEYSRSAKYKEPVPLMGRSAILGEQRNNDFCDVACGRGEMGDSTYAITRSGLLCEFNNRRLLDKWVELRTTSANCMAVGERHIFIGCAEGIVRCFDPTTLQFITTLPRTHYLGVDVAQGLNISHMASHPSNAKYPDAIAVAFDERNSKLSCVYNDHSLYVWDIRDIKHVGKSHSFLYHSACIWGVEMFPSVSQSKAMPVGSFLTCSSDDTIRVWNLDYSEPEDTNSLYRRNIYSKELLKVLYVDPQLNYLKDLDISGVEKGDNASYDGRNGVRSIRISPDGKHLASGDRAGNIRIHEIQTLNEICLVEAHDAEVLCLEYSRFENDERKLLASASRDRLIHIFDVDQGYSFVQTLDDHSSSITAVRFLYTHNQLQIVSCGADKSIIFRQLQGDQFSRGHNAAGKTTLYDMEVDCTQKHVLTACQDRNIRVYSVNSGKHTKTFKGSVGEDGSLIKVTLDASGILVASSCTDKTLCIYDYYSGECLATMLGHSELATGLRFTNDCRRLISASGDGCIFVWKMPHDLVVTMHARLSQQAARAGKRLNGIGLAVPDNEHFGDPPTDMLHANINTVQSSNYRFSVGQLPLWAKKQMSEVNMPSSGITPRTVEGPQGRWAQRIDPTGITVKSVYDSHSVIPFPLFRDKKMDSDGSKEDSSIDSGTETSRSLFHDVRRDITILPKQIPDLSKVTLTRGSELTDLHHQHRNRHLTDDSSLGSCKYEDIESTEHDGDVEDYSEGESTEAEPRHQLIYYPAAEDTNSDYTVNAMDVEELRRAQQRMRRPDLLLVPGEMSQSVSGSQESEDDEQASTPSGDNSERNMAALTISSESLDVISHREKFLKNTFESLSGAEMENETVPNKGKRSISSQHLGGGSRNSSVIQAARHTRDAETTRKREELQRRIDETRRKLQSVGYRSNLKTSQSIQDLSPRGTSYHDNRTTKQQSLSKVHLQPPSLGKPIDSNTYTWTNKQKCVAEITNNPIVNRPFTLNITGNYTSNNKYRKANTALNLSLPDSPVYEEGSPSKCLTDSEMGTKSSNSRAKRLSCSFYIDLKGGYEMNSQEACKSLESLSEIGQSIDLSIDDEKSDNVSDFSSDSLESAEFSTGKPPRRCVSEFQIFNSEGKKQGDKTKFHSEENILGDGLDAYNENGTEILDRHSSASFFLRRNDTCRSTESILTDESEYQYLFTNQDKEEYRSTESILTDVSDSVSKDYPEKRAVFRTRSLQDTSEVRVEEITSASRPETPFHYPGLRNTEHNRPKHESFFIPLDGNNVKNLPDGLAKRFQNHEKETKTTADQPNLHPVVAHKPPKPQQKPSKTQRKSWQKVPVNGLQRKVVAGVKARAAIWRNDGDLRRVWETELPVKDPGLNSVKEDYQENVAAVGLSNTKPVHSEKCEEIVCKEVKPSEIIVKEVVIDDISTNKKTDINSDICTTVDDSVNNNKNIEVSNPVQNSNEDGKVEEIIKGSQFKQNKLFEERQVPSTCIIRQMDNGKFCTRMPNVKLLSQNFERISMRSLPDEGILSGEETSFAPLGYDSGSSTPATSSSCTNSPKRHMNQLARRLKTNTLLPSKCTTVDEEAKPGRIRRSCSLSDLANPPNRQRMHANPVPGQHLLITLGVDSIDSHDYTVKDTVEVLHYHYLVADCKSSC